MKFNKDQELAINTIDKNVCVIAGAGTGKTAILTQRFINIIKKSSLDPKEAMEKILAITFTKKATNEMVDRISTEILKEEEKDPRFKGLYKNTGFLNISTIDSFCQKIISENSFKIGLPADYKIIQEPEANIVLDKALKEVFNKYIKDDKNLYQYLVAKNYAKEDYFLHELKGIYRKIQSKGYDFDELLQKNPLNNLAEPTAINPSNLASNLEKIVNELKEEKIINGRDKIVKDIKNGLLDNLRSNDQELVKVSLYEIQKGLENLSKKTDVDFLQNDLRDIILTFEKDDLKFYKLINLILKDLDQIYREEKKRQGLVEFSDLLYYTDILLENEKVLAEIKNKYSHIMIDEFQDTNSYQKKIFYKITSDHDLLDRNNLFVVGDPKQSIYGFRGSDLNVFQEVKEDIKKSGGKIIELKENYRSSETLVTYANKLFKKLMADKYTNLEAKIFWAKDPLYNKKIQLINIVGQGDDQPDEGEIIARKILDLKSKGRALADIGILFRSTTRLAELEAYLSKYNIPYINPKSREFYNKREIKDIILFFKFLNNPEDSESLYGLLRSNFFLIDDNSLFKLAKTSEKSLYYNLSIYKGRNDKITFAKTCLEKTLSLKDKVSIYELFKTFINSCNYYEFLKLTSLSGQEVENVKKFEELIITYEENSNSSVNEFLDFLLLEEKDDLNEALVPANQGAVNLMTIHGSKGLEFKSVIFYDSQNTATKDNSSIILNDKYGYGIRTSDNSQTFSIIQEANYTEELEERNRLLYVCLTRAKEDFSFVSTKERTNTLEKKSTDTSFFSLLDSLEDYDYDLIENIPEKPLAKKEPVKITTDESILERKKLATIEKVKLTSSISAYMVYKRCPREYFFKYKLGLRDDLLIDNEVGVDFNDNEDERSTKGSFPLAATQYGSLVHSIIEEIENYSELEDLITLKLMDYELEDITIVKERIRKNIAAYINHELEGKKYYEFPFILNLEEGFIQGTIDQLILADDEIKIVDFKSNRYGKISELSKLYKDQILVYSLAAEEIFDLRVKGAYVLFLERDKLVEIPLEKEEIEKLKKELNSFLRFIGDNDSIEKYVCCQSCNDNCKYKKLCNRW